MGQTTNENEPTMHTSPAEGFGAALKKAREEQGISLGDMAARSRLSVQQLAALEAEDMTKLPEPVYVRAFIRGVGHVLGLDKDALVADYTARFGNASVGVLPNHNPDRETVVSSSTRPAGLRTLFAILGVAVVVAAGWYIWSGMEKSSALRESPVAVEVPAAKSADKPADLSNKTPAATAEAPKTDEKVAEKAADASAQPTEPAKPADAPTEKPAALPAPAPAHTPKAEAVAATKSGAEKANIRRLELRTTGACWVQIVQADGRNIFAKEMAAGGRETLEAPAGARVTVGNANVMDFRIDGQSFELAKVTRGGICRFTVN